MEGHDIELKSRFDGSDKMLYDLIKTIVAMANSGGGRIIIEQVPRQFKKMLDSAALHDKIRKYVDPPVSGLRSGEKNGKWIIDVEKSANRPHVFKENSPEISDGKKRKFAFFRGQVYVRHSSKTETADHSDFDAILRDLVSEWLTGIGQAFTQAGIRVAKGESGLPVRISRHAPLALGVDPNISHPYTAKSLVKEVNKNRGWIVQTIAEKRLKEDRTFALPIYDASGTRVVQWRYSEAAAEELKRLAQQGFKPTYPKKGKKKRRR